MHKQNVTTLLTCMNQDRWDLKTFQAREEVDCGANLNRSKTFWGSMTLGWVCWGHGCLLLELFVSACCDPVMRVDAAPYAYQETSLYRFSVCSFELARCQRASGDGLGRWFEDETKDLGRSWSQKSLKEQKRVLYNGDRISLC